MRLEPRTRKKMKIFYLKQVMYVKLFNEFVFPLQLMTSFFLSILFWLFDISLRLMWSWLVFDVIFFLLSLQLEDALSEEEIASVFEVTSFFSFLFFFLDTFFVVGKGEDDEEETEDEEDIPDEV